MSLLLQDTLVISPATVQRIDAEIEEIKNNTDVADVVADKAELDAYDTSKLTDNAIIKVLQDESESDASTYYRYIKSSDTFELIGSVGPYYTKAESDDIEAQIRQDFADADADLYTAIGEEADRATGAEDQLRIDLMDLTTNLNTEISNRESADTTLQENIDAEQDRANNVEIGLQDQIGDLNNLSTDDASNLVNAINEVDDHADTLRTDLDNEVIRATSIEGDLSILQTSNTDDLVSAINSEVSDRSNADSILQDNITAEETRATGVENQLRTDLTAETTRATGKETELNTAITIHASNTSNPHSVTKAQVGLGNVDNTSDADKPISTATQTALNNKVDKTSTANQVYITDASGNQSTLTYSDANNANTVVVRTSGGLINVAQTPTQNTNATSKKYVDDRVNAAMTEAVVFKGIVANETLLPSSDNTNGDMYWITAFSSNPPTGMTKGRSGSAIYKGDPDNKFFYTEDAIYQPDEQSIDLDANGKLTTLVSSTANNSLVKQNDGLYVDISSKVDKVSSASKVYGTDASSNQTTYDISTNATANTIAYRAGSGTLTVGTPTSNYHATTKKYVDDLGNTKVDKVTVSTTTGTVALADNTIFSGNELSTLTITNPSNPTVDFSCQVNFTSGTTPTTVTASNIVWVGDNVSETTGFVPRANCRYTVMFMYDGSNIRGIIQGVSL